VTQLAMPVLFALFVGLGASEYLGWRLAMVVAGLVCFAAGVAYYLLTQDTPRGDLRDLRRRGVRAGAASPAKGTFGMACRDRRVWALFVIYAACFGIELTINNVAALYFIDYFALDLKAAGLAAALFGLMNLFARTLGGAVGDRFGLRRGLRGRVEWLFAAVLCEGLALMLFSQMGTLPLAIGALLVFSLFVQMSEGATFSVVPFVSPKALGSVAGIVGAGGNVGAVLAGFLFKGALGWPLALLVLGGLVTACAFAALAVRFTAAEEQAARAELAARLHPHPATLAPAA